MATGSPTPHPAPVPNSGKPAPYPNPTGGQKPPDSFTSPDPFKPPLVPGGDGTKGTSVDTPSMERFADNMDKLIAPLKDAQARLATVSVAPGSFYHANVMRMQVNGPNADSGLKKSYVDVLSALITGITDTRDGAKKLSHDYQAGEDGNKITAKKLAEAFANAPGDFNKMMTANGGSAAPSGSGGSSSGGSSSGGNTPK